jgi:epoxyqueuosine reductase QueG
MSTKVYGEQLSVSADGKGFETVLKTDIAFFLKKFSDTSVHNRVAADRALSPACAGIRMYECPLVGVSSARDALYEEFKKPDIVGEKSMLPTEWLVGAKSVISIFNPFTQHVKDSNAGGDGPSREWLHGRIDGQAYILAAAQALAENLRLKGAQAVVPAGDERFAVYDTPKIYSNWSERHAAYTAGLGTFSLNRALITAKGIAGRLCSVITDIELAPDERPYAGPYDNCSLCGTCIRACPAQAINKHGKAHVPCYKFLETVHKQYASYYGCGKCQCGMPCESTIPPKNTTADYSIIKNSDSGN